MMTGMRRVFKNIACLSLLMAALSCTKEKQATQMEEVTIIATNENETRATLDQNMKIAWESGDKISVFFGGGTNGGSEFSTYNSGYTAAFSGSLPTYMGDTSNNLYWAVYPYKETTTCDNSSVTVTLPAMQTACAGSFAKGENITVSCSSTTDMSFKNVCSWMRFSVQKEDVKKVTLTAIAEESIAGDMRIVMTEGLPSVTAVSNPSSTITLTAESGHFEVGQWYYICLIPTTFSEGFELSFEAESESATYSVTNPITFSRNQYKSRQNADSGLTYETIDPLGKGINIAGVLWASTNLEGQYLSPGNAGTTSAPVKSSSDPCPDGWRTPTVQEFESLAEHYSDIVTVDGVQGRWFTGDVEFCMDVTNKLFLYQDTYRKSGYDYYGNHTSSTGKVFRLQTSKTRTKTQYERYDTVFDFGTSVKFSEVKSNAYWMSMPSYSYFYPVRCVKVVLSN